MSKTTNPTVITEARTLSRMADNIVALDPARRGNKNTILNVIAQAICGTDRNWGFLKQAPSPVQDIRLTAPAPKKAAINSRPMVYGDLQPHQKFAITLPDGRTGFRPRAELTARPDGGIDITAHLWGPLYNEDSEHRLDTRVLSLDASACARISEGWPSPEALVRDTSWSQGQFGQNATTSEIHGQIALYVSGGQIVIAKEDLFTMACAQAGKGKKEAPKNRPNSAPAITEETASGYRYDMSFTYVSDVPLDDMNNLGDIYQECMTGEAVGGNLEIHTTLLTREERDKLALDLGSDPSFFFDPEDE